MKQVKTTTFCDDCGLETDLNAEIEIKTKKFDFCRECLIKFFGHVEEVYRHKVCQEVQGRRGWRKLGELDT